MHLFDQKYSENSNIVNYYYNINKHFLFEYNVKCHLFLWRKATFSASLLQSSESHDPSNMPDLPLKKNSYYYQSCTAYILCWNFLRVS